MNGRLGDFELHGVPNTFGNQGFVGLGDFGENIATQSVEAATRAKFGTGGVQAMAKYPCLRGARIASFLHMVEAGGGRFTLKRNSNNAVFARNIDPCRPFTSSLGKTVYTPGGGTRAAAPAGEVLGGIGSILGSITGPLAEIYITQQKAESEIAQIKAGRRPFATAAVQAARVQPGLQTSAAAARSGTNTAIIAIVVGVVLLGAMFMMMQKRTR